ncbi:MAG: formate dehydrogenase accessory sulfurtransferase FdhD [Saprospiraceae bacterium]|nr:formate dehydrogenase accessory sulfurtransferase FdhD [Saprospiraceae bacterium]MDW8230572.1 formate dehydrogenase accessory sulfurtransferase FdhD [Saprospiraceae bacterium]
MLLPATTAVQTHTLTPGGTDAHTDILVVEEPLEIRIGYGSATRRRQMSVAVTMRTPGDDEDLALGFLFTEGIVQRADQVASLRALSDNTLLADLDPSLPVDTERLTRHLFTASSCGVCGKASLDAVQTVSCYYPTRGYPQWSRAAIFQLPERLRHAQATFEVTGGLHASALFDAEGQLVLLREDIGRHNATDKVIGAALRRGEALPLRHYLLLVSGRAGFELAQKAAMAGIPCLAAVGAPSHLAVEMARGAGMTLVGFLRGERFNVYSHPERIL